MTTYALVNASTAPELTPTWMAQTALDAQTAYDTVFAPACGTLPVDIRVGCTEATDRVVQFVDVLDDPQALAYHSVDAQGRPTLFVGVNATRAEGGDFLAALTEAFTHEVFECARNPFCNRWLETDSGPDVADEACDPVQGSAWKQGQTAISNFTLPAWGDAGDKDGPYDHSGVLHAPFQCAPAGYLAFRDGSQHFGEKMSDAAKTRAGERLRNG